MSRYRNVSRDCEDCGACARCDAQAEIDSGDPEEWGPVFGMGEFEVEKNEEPSS